MGDFYTAGGRKSGKTAKLVAEAWAAAEAGEHVAMVISERPTPSHVQQLLDEHMAAAKSPPVRRGNCYHFGDGRIEVLTPGQLQQHASWGPGCLRWEIASEGGGDGPA